MAAKGWTGQLAAAAGVAAGAGAAQLGLGYGLGVVAWPDTATPDDGVWLGSLSWATWTAASATVFGAVVAGRLRAAHDGRPSGFRRLAITAAAAFGALLTVALVALPARFTVRPDTGSPQTVAAGYALIGVLLGLVVAYWAVVSRPIAANLILTAAWLWLLAAAAIVVELTLHRTSATYLNSWQFAELDEGLRYGTIHWPSALLTLLAALLLGGIAAGPAARRGELGLGTAISGAVGPLLVAAAFFALAPQLTGTSGQLASAYLIAPYGVLAGLAGSAVAVTMGRRAAARRAKRAAEPTADAGSGKPVTVAADDGSAEPVPAPSQNRGAAARGTAEVRSDPAGTAPGGQKTAPPVPGADAPASRQPAGAPAPRQRAEPATAEPDPSGSRPDAAAARTTPTAAKPEATGTPRNPSAAKPEAESRPGPSAADATGTRPSPSAARAGTAGPRSTVSAPPASPTVARINPPGGTATERSTPRKPPAKRSPRRSPGPDAEG